MAVATKKTTSKTRDVTKGTKSAFPKNISPMLATLVDAPFDDDDWIYEIKWDGYRAIAFVNKGKVELSSRNNKSFNEKFYAIHDALQKLKMNVVLDGEIIVANDKGLADFNKLQNWRSEADGQLLFYVFDILWHDGRSLMSLPLTERRAILEAVLPKNNDSIHLSEAFKVKGTTFFKTAEKMQLEGIMAKKADSVYKPGDRSKEWLKIKTATRHEVVIGGYTLNEGSSKTFSSLLVGVFKKDKFIYTGKIGTGFSEKMQQDMLKQFKPLITDKIPFTEAPDINKPSRFRPNPPKAKAVWLKPQLVCEVSYREITADAVMRHPSFQGMRIDKPAKKVTLEKETKTKEIIKNTGKEKQLVKKPAKQARKTLLNPSEEMQVKKIGGHEIKFTNLSKIYWPKDKISKRDMLNYYYQVAEYMIPYLKNRPQSLNRFPNGITGKSFYQKDVTGKVPDWIPKFPYTSDGEKKNFMLCNDEATLLYMASLGCIEFNPWSSTIQKPDHPDWCMIDLDPDKNSFDQVIEAANITREVLESAKVPCYCKTSGSTGIHIYIPLGKKYTYEESKEFARIIATLVHEETSKFSSIERLISNRKGKMYIDFLQNRPSATLASAYSLRPKPGATVSMPLHWDEVKKGLKMQDFNIHNALAKIKEQGDIFKPVLGKGINMAAALKALSE
jgi:bifunctional non-homologous end joining protein LigD